MLAGRQGVTRADFANAGKIATFRVSQTVATISGFPFFSHSRHHCRPFSDFASAMSLKMSLAWNACCALLVGTLPVQNSCTFLNTAASVESVW